jgi:DNA-binding transcriptional LysR family regulator
MQSSDRIKRRMKLQDLHVLMTVIQAGSMGKAAERLNTVQPAISRSIAELEHTLGVRLLDRHRHGVEPTAFGRALLDCGLAVFDDLRQGMRNIEYLSDPTAGEVYIGCTPILSATFVSAVIDRLCRRYPGIVFHIVTDYVETLKRELSQRNVDLLITPRLGPLIDERLGWEFLFNDSHVVVAGKQSPWARRRRIELAELVNESWVMPPPEGAFGSVAEEAWRASGLNAPRARVLAVSYEMRLSLLSTGRFLAIFPASASKFSTWRPEIKVLPVKLPLARPPNGIVVLKNRTLSPVAQLFINAAREAAKKLANG